LIFFRFRISLLLGGYLFIIIIIIIIITYLLTYLLTATELSLGGSSPYTGRDKTNKNKVYYYYYYYYYYLLTDLLQLSYHSVAVVLTLVETKQIRIKVIIIIIVITTYLLTYLLIYCN